MKQPNSRCGNRGNRLSRDTPEISDTMIPIVDTDGNIVGYESKLQRGGVKFGGAPIPNNLVPVRDQYGNIIGYGKPEDPASKITQEECLSRYRSVPVRDQYGNIRGYRI